MPIIRGLKLFLTIAFVATGLFGCSNVKPKQMSPEVLQPVWVNTSSGIYHHAGSPWYGSTIHGKYMNEVEAIKAGYHLARNEK